MSLNRTFRVFARDVAMGPRTMMALWLVVFPLLITFVVRLVFGDLIDPTPKLGVVDLGTSSVPASLEAEGSLEVVRIDSSQELLGLLETAELDAGLVLQPGFDQAVQNGEQPVLQLSVAGESLASNRIIVAVTAIDLIRGLAGNPAPVDVTVEYVGDAPSVPIEQRLVPMLVLVSVALAGIFLPAASIIQEKTTGTIRAILTTPLEVGEYFLAKGVVGFLMSFGVGVIALLANGGFSGYVGGLLVVIAVGALMSVQLGLILGAAIGDIQTMFTVWKGGGIFLFAPAVLFLFPSVPRWIAMLFPTYYFLGPLYDMTVDAATLGETAVEIGAGVLISVLLALAAGKVAQRMEARLAAA